jgi:hypothetical protein
MVIAMVALAVGQTLYTDHGDPTGAEQRVLWSLNRARSDPTAEGIRLAIPGGITESLTAAQAARTFPQPPLAMNAKIRQAARDYAQFMWDNDYFWHYFPDGTIPPASTSTPDGRMTAAGYANLYNWAENLATGNAHTAEMLEDSLMRDFSVPSRGHRTNMLDIYVVAPMQVDPGPRREVGIGYLDAGADKTGIYRYILVQDFAESTANAPFLVGTVYLDTNGNDEYDIGEGLGGVGVTVTGGSFRAVTASAGGYAFPCPASGTRDVTVAGTSLPATVVVSRAFSSSNLLVDVRVPLQTDTDLDGLPDFWEIRFGALAPGDDTDGDTFSNLQEFRGGSDPLVAASVPTPPVVVTPPPAGGGGSSDGGGGCGATGFEGLAAAILASLLFRARRRV